MDSLKVVLMNRDGMSSEEANESINDTRELLNDMLEDGDEMSAMDIMETEYGLEPDYLLEMMGF